VDTVERVVNGTLSMQLRWMKHMSLPWDDVEAEKTGREMFDRMFHMKFLPPGRG
jgi:ribonucleoside-triphosphate reductase